MTNANKIRSMTDEELAKWLSVHYECLNCEADESGTGYCNDESGTGYCNDVCWKILLDWLKKEG